MDNSNIRKGFSLKEITIGVGDILLNKRNNNYYYPYFHYNKYYYRNNSL